MNVKHTKKPETRVDVKYLSSLGIKTYGDNNLYPQTVRDIVDSSPTGRTCVERRSTYIEGNGLASQALAETVCDTRGNTVDDVHPLVRRRCSLPRRPCPTRQLQYSRTDRVDGARSVRELPP